MINRDNYFVTFYWMETELGLRGNEVKAFAIIYGLTQGGEDCTRVKYLSEWLNISRTATSQLLARLVEKGAIICETESGKPNKYRVADRFINDAPASQETPTATAQPVPDKRPKEAATNTRKRFVKPTIEEVATYCQERANGIDAEAFVSYYESKGWRVGSSPMQDWKAAVITWERKRKPNTPAQPAKDTNTAEARARQYAQLMQERADYLQSKR